MKLSDAINNTVKSYVYMKLLKAFEHPVCSFAKDVAGSLLTDDAAITAIAEFILRYDFDYEAFKKIKRNPYIAILGEFSSSVNDLIDNINALTGIDLYYDFTKKGSDF